MNAEKQQKEMLKTLIKSSSPIFTETQRFTQWWIWGVIGIIDLITIIIMMIDLSTGPEAGTDAAKQEMMLGFFSIVFTFAFTAVIILAFSMKTLLYANVLKVEFVPFTSKLLSPDMVRHAEVVTYHPIRDYGGWGVRTGKGGTVYNVKGNRGIRFDLLNGKHVLVGSQNPEELASFLRSAGFKVS